MILVEPRARKMIAVTRQDEARRGSATRLLNAFTVSEVSRELW